MKTQAPPHDPTANDADAREFAEYARAQGAAELEAALWATRRYEGLDAAAEAEFQAWLTASPAHAVCYDGLEQSFGRVRKLPEGTVRALKAGLPDATPAARAVPSRPASPGRRAWLLGLGRFLPQAASAAAIATLVLGGWIGWDHWLGQPTFERLYATERGQRLNVTLPDGSTLQLDAATQAEVRLYRQRREVRLADGQAMFTVRSDPAQPFEVLTDAVRISVVGTRFSVRHTQSGLDAGKTVVAVESGRVRVSTAGHQAPGGAAWHLAEAVELAAGQGVSADEAGRLAPVVSLPADGVAPWRAGRVSFDDTTLAQALAEFERYGDTGLVVHDPAVAALRLGGSFDLGQIGLFAQALPELLPVRLERRSGRTEIVRAR
ncbi:FecR family protein [Thauera linaloolentis]|uniref:Transmembrane sensor n=1 Tax=Thauera linaloolentis (strain DSM 12138 / JCM 21573 / CCUG 41526 / CIP 105981 / IAM 15112 / NBRC 102519 / 47Lol) TaxID=1123367 RepID=N6YUB0_THAL4|nr:FecR domain-containing protein [Thauera linaloolentis]ENO85967.1 transmembrane sensor [Thauera linaloolentis 47Lol = DSM 12138]MCM8567197.1 FecR domain-containing protein [Thauera linaloolentis]